MRCVRVRISLQVEFLVLVVEDFVMLIQFQRLVFLWVLGSTDAASHQLSLDFLAILFKGVAISSSNPWKKVVVVGPYLI